MKLSVTRIADVQELLEVHKPDVNAMDESVARCCILPAWKGARTSPNICSLLKTMVRHFCIKPPGMGTVTLSSFSSTSLRVAVAVVAVAAAAVARKGRSRGTGLRQRNDEGRRNTLTQGHAPEGISM